DFVLKPSVSSDACLSANEATLGRFVRVKVKEAWLVAALSLPIAVAIVVVDYRLMLFSFVVVAPLLGTLAEAIRAPHAAPMAGYASGPFRPGFLSRPRASSARCPSSVSLRYG